MRIVKFVVEIRPLKLLRTLHWDDGTAPTMIGTSRFTEADLYETELEARVAALTYANEGGADKFRILTRDMESGFHYVA